ncbi:hypothetical protein MGYG_05891 [Nannizzia gypsea CBS 118893]|uniref:Uncharacterized protein n=1 Tax=Arthroderma gypseum (strain ATCC MYA-4604 / CBS 118893) TaxID=535722 RepID=E4UZV3_ARTGP|nr:hypothetical protein MGYG_05891 [Nannizzia gypsea CBS 118893]EFR02890.1 hypothetical protein MGYG_05891 [Nannizzia gypsea CBS 118893]
MVDLPQQRQHAVRPGSSKEANLLAWVEAAVLRINRRHAKKFSGMQTRSEPGNERKEKEEEKGEEREEEDVPGYESFSEVAADIERVLDVLWVSNTPTIQVPYMITLAGLVDSYLRDYAWQARSTFALLDRLDAMLAALLAADEEGERVEGGGGGGGGRKRVSMTERVRIKSLVEGTRVTVFDVRDEAAEADDDDEEDDEVDAAVEAEEAEVGRWEMAAARVYEKSLSRL